MSKSLIKKIFRVLAKTKASLASLPILFYPKLWSLYRHFIKHPDAVTIIGPRDAFRLYRLARTKRPKRLLELGTGIGAATSVLALACPDADILSFEQEEKCARIAKRMIPRHLQSRVSIIYSPPYTFSLPDISPYQFFSGYKDLSKTEGTFDFVVIDGPAGWLENGHLVTLVNGDIVTLLPRLRPEAIVFIDHRKEVSAFCKRFLSLYLYPLVERPDYSLFVRSPLPLSPDIPLRIVDEKLERRKRHGYRYGIAG